MQFQKQNQLYSGKAKTLFATDQKDYLITQFRDDATAFNGKKHAQFSNKGKINNHLNAFFMRKLSDAGIATHFVDLYSTNESIVKSLVMFPVECVLRNIAAGSISRRLGIQEGIKLMPPILEFYLKSDALDDPMINESHIHTFQWASSDDVAKMKELTLKVNQVLQPLFLQSGLLLVDYKLEFGKFNNEIVLGDEITPDGCRIWDVETKMIFDKDRFRKDLGDLIEGYEEVARRLKITIP